MKSTKALSKQRRKLECYHRDIKKEKVRYAKFVLDPKYVLDSFLIYLRTVMMAKYRITLLPKPRLLYPYPSLLGDCYHYDSVYLS